MVHVHGKFKEDREFNLHNKNTKNSHRTPPPPPGKQTQPLDPVPGNFFLMDSRISVHLASIRKVEGQTKSGGANEKKNNINFSKS